MKIDVVLSGINLLSMETAPFIYYTESRPIYVDKMRDIFRRIGKRQFSVISSTIALSECLTKPLKESDFALVKAYNDLFETTYGLTMVSVDMEIARRAAELRAKYGLKTPDALHVATALETGCQAFLTNDMKLKQITEIQILVLDELEVS